MKLGRRSFFRALLAGGWWLFKGPRAAAARSAALAGSPLPEGGLLFLTPSEYSFINRMAREIIPDEPVLSGRVDVAANIDRFLARENANPDFLKLLDYLRLVRLAEPALPLIRRFLPLVYDDIMSFKRTICFLGYYSDLNGEADLPREKRVVWPRIGYEGPKPEDYWPPLSEPQLDPDSLPDRIQEELP